MHSLYMDVHVPVAVTVGLRRRGIDVLTAQEDGARELDDEMLLDRASQLCRVLFTQDDDLLSIASQRQQLGEEFAGVIYCHQMRLGIGDVIDDLELMATCATEEELRSTVTWLPVN